MKLRNKQSFWVVKKLCVILCLIMPCICAACGTGAEPYTAILENAADELGISSIHAVIQNDGGTLHTIQYGDDASENGLYCIGSISKSFVAVLALKLQEEGRIDLDEKVAVYLPELDLGNKADIIVQDLLTMRSGIADYTADFDTEDYYKEYDVHDLIQKEVSDSVFTKRGEFVYSNTNILIAGQLIEKVTGQSCEHLIREKILLPLGMKDTFFAYEKESIRSKLIPGFSYTTDGRKIDFTDTTTSWAGLACGMYATVDDLAIWVQALADPDFLSVHSRKILFDFIPADEHANYGLCLMRKQINGIDMIAASGNVPGYGAAIAAGGGVSIVTACNLSDYSGNFHSYAEELAELLAVDALSQSSSGHSH